MIYKNLRTIPMITFIEIIETMDLELLSDEKLDPDELILIWQKYTM